MTKRDGQFPNLLAVVFVLMLLFPPFLLFRRSGFKYGVLFSPPEAFTVDVPFLIVGTAVVASCCIYFVVNQPAQGNLAALRTPGYGNFFYTADLEETANARTTTYAGRKEVAETTSRLGQASGKGLKSARPAWRSEQIPRFTLQAVPESRRPGALVAGYLRDWSGRIPSIQVSRIHTKGLGSAGG